MKKTYISPRLKAICQEPTRFVALSIEIHDDDPIDDPDDILVREENEPLYNVWDNEW